MSAAEVRSFWRNPLVIVVLGCSIAVLTFGPRSTMGFLLTPMTTAHGWSREIFALAIAIQNLAWGVAQPFVGMIADRYGTARTLTVGAILYSAGLATMAFSTDPLTLNLTAGVLVGLGVAGSAFFLVLAAFARMLPPEWRTTAYGLGTAAGSLGQFLFAPIGQALLQSAGWQGMLLALAVIVLAVPLLSTVVRGKPASASVGGRPEQTLVAALGEAFRHGSYRWLVLGFFVCGFHIAFITNHLPAYLSDKGIPAAFGAYAIGLIGLFNIVGAITAGVLSARRPKRWILSAIYLARAVAITAFVLVPVSIPTVLLFSAAMGLLWLSTVPPTQGLVTVMFGTRYMATLFGFVFFSHQVGAFFGVWLGGVVYDRTGSYDTVWWISVALGVFAALVHMPISERPVARLAPAE